MKTWLTVATFLVSNSALALANDCKLVSDGNGIRIWQCASTPASDTASQTKSGTVDNKN
jgi:hypothetical protein